MYDEELEKAMLSHILFGEYEADLTEKDFIDSKNRAIIKAVNELKKTKEEISIISVKQKIKGDGQKIVEYLATLTDYAIGTEADDLYNRIIDLSQKRELFEMLQQKKLIIQDTPVEDFANDTIKDINNILQRKQKEETFLEQISKTAEDIEKKYNDRNDYSLYTEIKELDKKILGLHNGELTIIGARPRCRKNNISFTNRAENSRKKEKCCNY